jgi:4'-phosphopantetheinyl transferase
VLHDVSVLGGKYVLDWPRIPPLEPGIVQLWHARTGSIGDELAALLNNAERSRAERFVFAANRNEFVLGRAMLRLVLARHLDVSPRAIAFRLGPFGKPELAGEPSRPPVYFNVSHSAGLVVAAFSLMGEVGVDVEDTERPISPAVQRQVFAPEERQSWESLPPDEQGRGVAARWTLKEAFLKAHGAGLNLPLLGFVFDESSGEPRIRFSPPIDDDPARWRFYQTRVARHVVSLALAPASGGREPPEHSVELHDFNPHLSIQTRHDRSVQHLVTVG